MSNRSLAIDVDTSFNAKNVLVTGAAGTVGKQLVKTLLEDEKYRPQSVTAIDNNESELFYLEHEFSHFENTYFHLAEIRDRSICYEHMEHADIVIHAAALKHVVMCERNPMESVNTNILGLENLISAARHYNVERFIFTSSDKAVNPTNVMGTTKLLGERLISATNGTQKVGSTIFSSTRFGNVLGSNGSVLPIFAAQIKHGGPVTVTHAQMTRFVMTIEKAATLVLESALLARGGEVFITKMPVIRINDLAEVMIEEIAPAVGQDPSKIDITIIGAKPGEKLYEELMSDEEIARSQELQDYFVVTPPFRNLYRPIEYSYSDAAPKRPSKTYISSNEPPLSKGKLTEYLYENRLI